MENVLNRRMFQQPIYAKSGVYVPTIEQIMNFYGGGFTAAGEPNDMEAFQIAIQNANKANEAGLFEDGKPIDTWENLLPRPISLCADKRLYDRARH